MNLLASNTSKGCGGCLFGSVFGVIFGIALFFGSFVVLWQNEGRTDLSTIADDSIAISAASVDPANEGKLVAAAGTLVADTPLGDPDYLQSGNYLTLERTVEMYAWQEKRRTVDDDSYEYLYATDWTAEPKSSDTFSIPAGHRNPALTVHEDTFTVPTAHVGTFAVDLTTLTLPPSQPVRLTDDNVREGTDGRVSSEYLYMGRGTLANPRVGDVRIRFMAVPGDISVTAFGKQEGTALQPFVRGDDRLYLAHAGDRAGAIAALHSTYQVMGWLFRVVGFLMMWFGITVMSGPLTGMLSFIPFLGNAGRMVIGAIAFVVALILTSITVIISALLHNIVALLMILVLVAAVGGVLYWQRTKGESAVQPATPSAAPPA